MNYPILSRDKVREAVARAMLFDAEAGSDASHEAAAQSLGVPVEVVIEALEPAEVA